MATPGIFTLGKFEVIELLGQGGNAMVYKAYHRDIDRYLAIKVFRPQYTLDPQFGDRFRQEARTIARLQHPHIVPLYDYGNEDNIWYLATAYIQGGSLADLIPGDPMSLPKVDKTLREIVSALDYAHRQGVTHRAIKPSNILLDSEGHALLSDFGIFNIAGTGTVLLDTGDQIAEAAQTPHQDRRADLYALAVIVFEMLTGQSPYRARNAVEAALMQANSPVPSVIALREDLPPALELVMGRALAKNPDERYESAADFYEDFSRTFHSDDSVLHLKMAIRSGEATAVHNEGQSARQPVSPESTLMLEDGGASEAQPTIVSLAHSRRRILQVGVVALAMLAVIAVFLVNAAPRQTPTFGRLTFGTGSSPGDTAQLEVQALPPPQAGQHYVAWLENTSDGSITKLGTIDVDGLGAGSLVYIDPEGRVLLSLYDRLVITSETGDPAARAGAVRYTGQVFTPLSPTLKEILIKSAALPEEANKGASYGPAAKPLNSLLDGALAEAGIGQMHSGLAARAPNLGALSIHAEHTINIMLGTRDDYNGNSRGENPGRKLGILFFLDKIDALLITTASDPAIPTNIKDTAQGMLVCSANIRHWMNRVIELEHELLVAQDLIVVEPQKLESTQLATAMLEGTDLNQNGEIELVEGECGLQQIADYTLELASMPIVEGIL